MRHAKKQKKHGPLQEKKINRNCPLGRNLVDKDFRSAISSMLKELKETTFKELKETEFSPNIHHHKEREIIKRSQIEIWELTSTTTEMKIQ